MMGELLVLAAFIGLWILWAALELADAIRSSQISRKNEMAWGIDPGMEGGDQWDHMVLEGVADFEDADSLWDNETGADGKLSNGAVVNSAWPQPEQSFMEVAIGHQTLPWHSSFEARHPDCQKYNWELRTYHNTPDEQYLALHCGNCGKTVDPSEIINALIAHMEES